ncbi:DUF421 domain-containing protein [Bacillus sp. 03113]|uniref:DUF421 domain-containing protein n=1 Tax=Bacillus sp. 03113 TaxID=2578211 RepID=UPI001143EF70|nr:DUF421 domain-containing protein [Bacillus sp. 03113]
MEVVLSTLIRSIFIIIGLFVITKIQGKKQLSKLSFFEYIVGITVGDIAGTISMDSRLKLSEGITALLIWAIFPLIISILSLKSKPFRDFVEGTSTTFIENGNVLEKNLKKEKYSTDELLEQLRKKNVFSLADVEFASLDSNGDLSVLLKKEKQPVLIEDLVQNYKPIKVPQTVITDGSVYYEGLRKAGLTHAWLMVQLENRKLSINDIFLAQIDYNGNLYIDTYDDSIKFSKNT